jgi:hypothetical protein
MCATGAEVDLLDSGSCDMAGPFGFEAEHYDVSQALAERVFLPAVRSARRTLSSPTASLAARPSHRTAHAAPCICPKSSLEIRLYRCQMSAHV